MEILTRNLKAWRTAFLPVLLAGCFFTTAAAQEQVGPKLEPCPNKVAVAQQVDIGKKAAQQVYQQMPVLPDSSEVTQYVQRLGQKLVQYAPGERWPFNFHVVNVADINAFALPGGSIFVNLGTIQAADTEAQLAAVMAHEISHVVLQHSICNMEKEQRVGLLAGLGQLAAGLALGNGVAGQLAQETIGLGAGLGFLKMSRGAEKQADQEGLEILYHAGYDPRAMAQFFEIIDSKYGKGGAQFLSDHPNPGNRTEYVMQEISTFPPQAHYVTNTDEFRRIHQMVAGMHAYTAKEVQSGVWKKQSPNTTVETGINQYDAASVGRNVDLSQPRSWNTFKGDGFTVQVPSNWRVLGNQNSAMIAPPGGIGQTANGQLGNLEYGVLLDVYTPQQGMAPNQEFGALVDELRNQNPGLQTSSVTSTRVAGRQAQSVQCDDSQANQGRGERDWIVGVPMGNALRYFVFVAPEQDFQRMQPTFTQILNSIKMR